MNGAERKRIGALLWAQRQELTTKGDEAIAPNRQDETTPLDEDAQALNEMHQVLASRHNRERLGSLAQIDRALARLREAPEDFGLCADCEEEIPLRRLELMPHVEYCVACQAKRDAPRGVARRSITDYRD